jgi:hypothetical protein
MMKREVAAMPMTTEELYDLCLKIRRRDGRVGRDGGGEDGSDVDDGLVSRIESDVREYRELLDDAPEYPPAPLDELLPLMGWLIYEASLDRLWNVAARFEALPAAQQEESRANAVLISRLADAARGLPWPEFAPRALGAIRALALVESKRDTEVGYDTAWTLHEEAREKYQEYVDSHGNQPSRDQFILALQEVLIQLALAEAGTACRTAERVIGRWVEEFEKDDPKESEEDSGRWTQRMFRQLSDGIDVGTRALDAARKIKEGYGFVHEVTEKRLTLATGLRNPAIMTCRAILLAYSMCPEMEGLDRDPGDLRSWKSVQQNLLDRFDKAFGALRMPVQKKDGTEWPLNADHLRSMVQLCLHLALVTPTHQLAEPLKVDDDLTLYRLDGDAVEAMSAWIATEVDGKQRDDANTIGSASKPSFIASVDKCREDGGATADYRNWRRRWPRLDRYADEDGRRERIVRILGCAPA